MPEARAGTHVLLIGAGAYPYVAGSIASVPGDTGGGIHVLRQARDHAFKSRFDL